MLPHLSRHRSTAKSFVRRPEEYFGDTSIEIPQGDPPPLRKPTRMRRNKTLSRPERGHPVAPLLNPEGPAADPFVSEGKKTLKSHWWHYASIILTFWAPPPLLSMFGLKNTAVRQAWREKMGLVMIACLLSAIVVYITVWLHPTLCRDSSTRIFVNVKEAQGEWRCQRNLTYRLGERARRGIRSHEHAYSSRVPGAGAKYSRL